MKAGEREWMESEVVRERNDSKIDGERRYYR